MFTGLHLSPDLKKHIEQQELSVRAKHLVRSRLRLIQEAKEHGATRVKVAWEDLRVDAIDMANVMVRWLRRKKTLTNPGWDGAQLATIQSKKAEAAKLLLEMRETLQLVSVHGAREEPDRAAGARRRGAKRQSEGKEVDLFQAWIDRILAQGETTTGEDALSSGRYLANTDQSAN